MYSKKSIRNLPSSNENICPALVNLCLSLVLASPSIPPNCPPAMNVLLLFLSPGFLLGWLRVSDKPYSHARPGADGDWKILSSHLRGILHRKNESYSLTSVWLIQTLITIKTIVVLCII